MDLDAPMHRRRAGQLICAIRTVTGSACRAIPTWKCVACATNMCGVHVHRNTGMDAPACIRCNLPTIRLQRGAPAALGRDAM
jgi:hypothetical protein